MSYRFAGAYFEEESKGVYYHIDIEGVYTIKYVLMVKSDKSMLTGFVFDADGDLVYNTTVEGNDEQQVYVNCKTAVSDWMRENDMKYVVNDGDEK